MRTFGIRLCFLLLCTSVSSAQEMRAPGQPSDPSSDLSKLIYFPHAQKVQITTALEYTATENQTQSITSSSMNDSTLIPFTLGIQYGLFPRFQIGVSETERFYGKTTSTNNQSTSSGASNPTFNVQYRLLENCAAEGWCMDISTNISPNWVAPGRGRTGSGYGTAKLSIPLFFTNDENEFGLVPALQRFFRNTSTASPASNALPYWLPMLTFEARFHFLNYWFQPEFTLTSSPNLNEPRGQVKEPAYSFSPTVTLGRSFGFNWTIFASANFSDVTTTLNPVSATQNPSTTDSAAFKLSFNAQMQF